MVVDGEDEFVAGLRLEFCDEGQEALFACEGILLNLDKSGINIELVREFNRLLHSIKGSATAVEMDKMAAVIHLFETYVGRQDSSFVDTSFKVIDNLREALSYTKDGLFDKSDEILNKTMSLIE